jgi:hypothetical protein
LQTFPCQKSLWEIPNLKVSRLKILSHRDDSTQLDRSTLRSRSSMAASSEHAEHSSTFKSWGPAPGSLAAAAASGASALQDCAGCAPAFGVTRPSSGGPPLCGEVRRAPFATMARGIRTGLSWPLARGGHCHKRQAQDRARADPAGRGGALTGRGLALGAGQVVFTVTKLHPSHLASQSPAPTGWELRTEKAPRALYFGQSPSLRP